MAYDFLNEPLIEAVEAGAPVHLSLPGLFTAWGAGRDVSLTGIRRHQRAAMHMFLTQVAVGALDLSHADASVAVDEDEWRERLLTVAPSEAWHLLADRDDKPALLQAPVAGTFRAKYTTMHPDSLTILVSSKNHHLKQNMVNAASPWTWLCSLVELQTMCGYLGATNYNIVRMNGGQASRPMVGIYPDMAEGARWSRDVLRYHDALVRRAPEIENGFADEPGTLVATWIVPWDGASQISLSDLHPAFVEVARRIRLIEIDGRLGARVGGSERARIAAPKELCGRTGDPWAPKNGDAKILTVPADGWSLTRLRQLVTPGGDSPFRPCLMQILLPGDRGEMFFHAAVVTGGQGKTEGFHEVTLPIPARVVSNLLTRSEGRQMLGQVSVYMAQDADVASSALRRALLTFLRGGIPPTDKPERWEAEVWVGMFQKAVRDAFFPALWDAADTDPSRVGWRKRLLEMAVAVYEEAATALPSRSELFYRAHTRGKGMLIGRINKEFAAAEAPAKEAA